MLKTSLLILTLMADGGTRVTLTEQDSPDECEGTRDVITQILTEADNPPILTACGQTELRLTPFEHGVSPEAEINQYRVEIPVSGDFRIAPLATDETCEPDASAKPAVYCARSAQQVIGND
ncbi:MAG: hypothetical protein ACK5II_08675 [Paracoccus sp. (in: a-proteobacteria)]